MNNIATKKFAYEIRKTILEGVHSTKAGHLGGEMSMSDLLAVLYNDVLRIDPKNPKLETRDRLVVSKGHCGPSVYAALALKGFFPYEWIETINQNNTKLPSHLDMNKVPGVDMTTGSLGQGMSAALGLAFAMKHKKYDSRVYLVLGDGECDEGQVWEGALFASTKKLNNVIAFVDRNLKQLDGYTRDICDVGDLRSKFEEFGWYSLKVDGHDCKAIYDAIIDCQKQIEKPSMIILDTIKGKDCIFCEDKLYNHHVTFTDEEYNLALEHLDKLISEVA